MKVPEVGSRLKLESNSHVVFSWMILLSLISFMSGCAVVRGEVGKPFPEDRLAELQKGISTWQDVAQRVGVPEDISSKPDGMVFRYRYGDSKTMRVNF